MHKGHIQSGTVEGTGAAINLKLGFVPQHVRLVNEDGFATLDWFNTMPDGSGVKNVQQAVAEGGTANYVVGPQRIATGGITPYAGTRGGDGAGFTIGADADLNVSGETLHWFAYSADS